MTAPKFVLADPPEADGNGGGNSNPVYEHFAAFLRAHPDQWAEWPHAFYSNERASNTAAAIRRGSYVALRGGYEVVSRDRVVYVRYTGKPAQNRLDTVTAEQCRAIVREEIRAALDERFGSQVVCHSVAASDLEQSFLRSSRAVDRYPTSSGTAAPTEVVSPHASVGAATSP